MSMPGAEGASRLGWFAEARFGLFVHFGLAALAGREISWHMSRERIPSARWRAQARHFRPDRLDPRAWARAARAAGMRYGVLTAKHHEGFCLFDSSLTDYTSLRTPIARDIVGEFVRAFREEGLRVGLYYSLVDWDHPDYPVDRFHPERDDPAARARPRAWERYVAYLHGQVEELLTRYGPIDLLWFDFSYDGMSGEAWQADRLLATARRLQPGILVNNRLVGGHARIGEPPRHGDFATPEQRIPPAPIVDGEGNLAPWEACLTLNETWGYDPDDQRYKSAGDVVRVLAECVSKGGNLLLNVGPDARGAVPPRSREILEGVGRWLDSNGASIYGCGPAYQDGQLLPKPEWGLYTQAGNDLYGHLLAPPPGPLVFHGLGGRISRAWRVWDGVELSVRESPADPPLVETRSIPFPAGAPHAVIAAALR